MHYYYNMFWSIDQKTLNSTFGFAGRHFASQYSVGTSIRTRCAFSFLRKHVEIWWFVTFFDNQHLLVKKAKRREETLYLSDNNLALTLLQRTYPVTVLKSTYKKHLYLVLQHQNQTLFYSLVFSFIKMFVILLEIFGQNFQKKARNHLFPVPVWLFLSQKYTNFHNFGAISYWHEISKLYWRKYINSVNSL